MLDTKTPFRWPVPWRAKEKPAPVYLLRAAGVVERELIEADLAGEHRAGTVYPFQLTSVFQDGVRALIGARDAADAEALVQLSMQRAALDAGETMSETDEALLAGAEAVLTDHYPPYRALVAQARRRDALMPVVAFRALCVGWEGIDVPFECDWAGVKLETVACLDRYEMRVAGITAYNRMWIGSQSGN